MRHLGHHVRGERDGSSSTSRSTKTLWCCPRLLPRLRFILIQLFISGCSRVHYWQEFLARTWGHTSMIDPEFIPAGHYPVNGRMMSESACQAVHLRQQKSLHCEWFHWIAWLRQSRWRGCASIYYLKGWDDPFSPQWILFLLDHRHDSCQRSRVWCHWLREVPCLIASFQ
jgi:hypothetical protein